MHAMHARGAVSDFLREGPCAEGAPRAVCDAVPECRRAIFKILYGVFNDKFYTRNG